MSALFRLKPRDYLLILRLYYWLHYSKWQIERKSLKQVVKWIENDQPFEGKLDSDDLVYAKKVGRFTERISRFTFHKSKCYDKALAVKQILNKKKISSSLIMGLKSNTLDDLEAHAWVKCGDLIVIGGIAAPEYTAVRQFS